MTNRELLHASREKLGSVERQRQYVPLDALTATGIDIDEYQFGQEKHSYQCPERGAHLGQVVTIFASAGPGWHWEINHDWLADRLHRAALYDQRKEKV